MVCWLTLNRGCNIDCLWCYARDKNFSSLPNMPIEMVDKILFCISEMPIKKFILIGGEPTLYKQLPLVIKKVKPVKVLLVTNAIKLANMDYLKLLQDSGLDMVTVSFKGASEEQYRANTGGNYLKCVEKAIRNLNELNITYSVSVTFSYSIMNDLPFVLDWLKTNQVKAMSINYCRPVIINNQVNIDDVPHPKEMAKKTLESYQMVRLSGIKCIYNFLLPLCLLPIKLINELVKNNSLNTVCQLQKKNGLIFMPDGKLAPCNHLFGYSFGKTGVDFNTPKEFGELINNDKIKSFYQKTQSLPNINCTNCNFKTNCGGGCFIQYLQYKSSEIIVKPFN